MRQLPFVSATFLACLSLCTSPTLLAEIARTPTIENITQVQPPITAPDIPATTPAPESQKPAVPANPTTDTTKPMTVETTPPTAVSATTVLTTPLETAPDGNDPREKIKNAVVKVHVVQHTYETLAPWNSNSNKGSGSGLLIEGNFILTNAHVAANATFLEVQRHGETERHEAEVVHISHESDLALLRTKKADVYKGVQPLELGDLPKMQQQVEVYGFPIGGNTLSVTRGVVSRIEKQNYVHTGENLIAVQVDAAINFGNSGGPVISEGKVVGVAMQSGFFTENIGYMIPTPIIRHVLNDIKDGKVDGYGFHGFLAQSMENPAMRRRYGLQDGQTGMLVHKVYKNSPASGKIEIGDIVTEIDGHKLENNGTVEFRPGEFIDYTHYIDMHQIGENIRFKILRKGQAQEVSLHLNKPGKEYLLVKPNQHDKQPSYFIFGGFVFMPLNQDVIDAMEPPPARISALTNEAPDDTRNEAVIMVKVLPADINKDYHHRSRLLIEKMDGKPIRNFRDFYERIQSSTADYITLEATDDFQIVIDRKEAIARQPEVLKQYGISDDRSKDLQAISAIATMPNTPSAAGAEPSATITSTVQPSAPATIPNAVMPATPTTTPSQ